MSNTEYLSEIKSQLLKALDYLDYSYRKVLKLPDNPSELNQETLETWESFTARFSRVADIFMAKYIRAIILHNDPAFRGALRDYINTAEKLGIINDVEKWMTIRALRNISANEYNSEETQEFFKQLKLYAPELLAIKNILDSK